MSTNFLTVPRTLSKFRSECHNLAVTVGRHRGIPRQDRLCTLCKDEVENEIHCMLQSPVYETLRQKYLPRKYYIRIYVFPNVNKFNILQKYFFL